MKHENIHLQFNLNNSREQLLSSGGMVTKEGNDLAPVLDMAVRLDNEAIIFGLLLTFGIITNVIIIFKIIMKNVGNFKPLHVYQINFFCSLLVIKGTSILVVFFLTKEGTLRSMILVLLYFGRINLIFSIFIQQYDRLIAIKNPFYHNSEVTINLAYKMVASQKVLAILVVAVGSLLDEAQIKYQRCINCVHVRPVSIYTSTYPFLMAFLITLAVSIYASYQIIRLYKSNKVWPTVRKTQENEVDTKARKVTVKEQMIRNITNNEDSANIEEDPVETTPTGKDTIKDQSSSDILTNNKIILHRSKTLNKQEIILATKELIVPTLVSKENKLDMIGKVSIIDIAEKNRNKAVDVEINVEDSNSGTSTKSVDCQEILREIENNSTNVNLNLNFQREAKAQKAFKMMLLKTLKINMITLMIFIYIVPKHILILHYQSCYESQEGCTKFEEYFTKVSFLQFFVSLIHPLIVLKLTEDLN